MRHRHSLSIACGGVALPITPMLDMTFQLLFFLVLTFRSEELPEGSLQLQAPVGPTCLRAPLNPPEVGTPFDQVLVVARALPDGSGQISALTVRSFEGGEYAVGNTGGLQRWLVANRPLWSEPPRVMICPDDTLKFACVIEVFDACRQAGIDRLGFTSAEPWPSRHRER